jgi:hypothetical protein
MTGDAISFGGLKLMILIRVAPTPVFWATVVFATVEAPLSHFLITYALVNLKYALYCYIGSAAENLMAAMRSGDCDAEGGGGDCDAVLPEVRQQLPLPPLPPPPPLLPPLLLPPPPPPPPLVVVEY